MAIVNFRIIFLVIMPLILIISFFTSEIGNYLASLLIFIYFCLSVIWIILSLEDKQTKS